MISRSWEGNTSIQDDTVDNHIAISDKIDAIQDHIYAMRSKTSLIGVLIVITSKIGNAKAGWSEKMDRIPVLIVAIEVVDGLDNKRSLCWG